MTTADAFTLRSLRVTFNQTTPELISFCETLTGVIAIAVLTDDPLDAPFKGFPPNQPNLISAIETWLTEL
ncbi:hypothetical protein [Sodalinema gerasimenkoae]|uniref:NACHT C-terminal alpha/beta 1 domain-containing protein n=1 Tax=Sodalinema gerasimenkoae TaxID=2862348 RepID=UPI0013585465|nr:hypothetical protein [Sodalinema gerasimenkoae]